MGFMAYSRRLDQTGMYLKNEYSVFKGHPDFRPYKVSLTRILRLRVGLVGALWLSLQDYLRFVLTFSVFYTTSLGQKNTPLVSQRGIKDDSILFSVNWYPFISWWPFESRLMYQKSNAHLSKSDKLYSPLGIFAVLRYSFMAFTKSWGLLKYCFTKSYDFTSCIRRFVLQNSLALWTIERELDQNGIFIHLCSCFTATDRAVYPSWLHFRIHDSHLFSCITALHWMSGFAYRGVS